MTIFERGVETTCRLLTRRALPVGGALPGPALMDDATSTIYVPRGWRAERDEHDNLVLRRAS